MTTVLIDADVVLYRSCWAVQKTHYTHVPTGEFFDGKLKAKKWFKEEYLEDTDFTDVETWVIVEEIEPWPNCKFLLDNCIEEIMHNTGAENKKLFLSPKRTFRHDLATISEYKGGRPPPPHYKKKATEYLIERYFAEVGNNIEADDLLGLNQDETTIIASIDKDLLMIPGRHYNIVSKEETEVDLLAADDWFFIQLLAGDRVDNIKGIPGVGVKTAVKIVAGLEGDHNGLVDEIANYYEEHYPAQGQEIMEEMAQLVYILRRGDKPGAEQWRKLLLLNGT